MLPHEYLAMVFEEFALFHAMHSTPFKPQAYELAMEAMLALGPDVKKLWKKEGVKGLEALPGIGPATAAKTDEYLRTGHVKEYEAMKKEMPIDMHGLAQIEGLGPKHMLALWKALKVKDIPSLKKAIAKKKIRTLKGFGVKSEEKLARAIGLLKLSSGRMPIKKVLPVAQSIVKRLHEVEGVERCCFAGSLRRKKATIGDIDLLATSSLPKRVMEAFIHLPEVIAVHEIGPTRSSVRLSIGIDADLRVVPDEVFGAALQYFTGDRRHNIFLREHAIKLGYKLNEYGLFKNGKLIACKTEDDIYKALGLHTPVPEARLGYDEFIPLAPPTRRQISGVVLKDDRPKKAASPRRKSNTKSRGRKASTRA